MRKWVRMGWQWWFLIILAIILIYDKYTAVEILELKVPGNLAKHYRSISNEYQLPWYYLAAIDEIENRYQRATPQIIEQKARRIKQETSISQPSSQDIELVIKSLYGNKKSEAILHLAHTYRWIASPMAEPYSFPLAEAYRKQIKYKDTWGASRTYGGNRQHEGTDLMMKSGTPILSVSDGIVIKKGWNRLGGWRLLIMDKKHPQISYYYAHLEKYADGMAVGSLVRRGQLLAYAGDTGYGPQGTSGKFPPHLHFGIYVRKSLLSLESKAINPYPLLQAWDSE